jgi:hypothetical protein
MTTDKPLSECVHSKSIPINYNPDDVQQDWEDGLIVKDVKQKIQEAQKELKKNINDNDDLDFELITGREKRILKEIVDEVFKSVFGEELLK